MKYCEKCKVLVPSGRERCPLCQGFLSDGKTQGHDDEIFPYIPTVYHQHNLLIRVSLFLSITLCVVCFALNLLVWNSNWWSMFVLAAEAASWATIMQAIRKRSTFCKHVLYQMVTIAIVVVLFDLMTGFHRWSFDYVIPALAAFTMTVVASIAVVGHRLIGNYIIYMVVSAVFGIVPLLFLLVGWTQVLWPTVLTASASVIYLAALILFVGNDTRIELKKRLHM